ncbi:MAG: hypothetical protein IPG50_22820 [Myxococcales bacterium]|nr:hypothetical protein [Myxococcales bacterium]
MRRHSLVRFMVSGLTLVTAIGISTAALADEKAPAKPAKTSTTAAKIDEGAAPVNATRPEADKVDDAKATESTHKKISIAINPLAVAIGRYSIQGEYLPAVHHAITLNPNFTSAPVKVTVNGKEVDGGSLTGFGGELGYRFYTGTQGPNGFFVGPSLLFSSFSQSAPSGATNASSDSFTSVGGAIDIGGQGIIGPGIVLGGGFGLQYTTTSKDIATENLNLASAVIAGGGIRPRFLVHAGYAF